MSHPTMQMIRCPKCRLFNSAQALACDRCGHLFQGSQPFQQPVQPVIQPIFDAAGNLYQACPRCGTVSHLNSRFCAGCGQSLVHERQTAPQWGKCLMIWLTIPLLLMLYPWMCPHGIGNDGAWGYLESIPTVFVWCSLAIGCLILDCICAFYLSKSSNETDKNTALAFYFVFVLAFLIIAIMVYRHFAASFRSDYTNFGE